MDSSYKYFLRGDQVPCHACLYYYHDRCEHLIVRAPKKTVGCDHGETAAMRLERMSRAAKRASHSD